VVKINDAKIGKRKFNSGRRIDGFSIFDSGNTSLVPMLQRDSATLVSVIKNWIRPGTTIIMSDCWRAYDCLSVKGFDIIKLTTP